MLANPRPGQPVEIRYNARMRPHMPLQDRRGLVVTASRGKPRDHLVPLDGALYVIPCGNLFPI